MGLLHGGLLRATKRADVVAVVDPSRSARFLVTGTGLNVKTYASLDAALGRHQADAVFVCTPPRIHETIARSAIENRLHLFVEKPLTTSASASKKVADEASSRGLRGFVGYVRRHHVVYSALRRQLHGKVMTDLSVRIRSPQFVGVGHLGLQRGGLEWDLLPHATDMAFWLAGATSTPTPLSLAQRGLEQIETTTRIGPLNLTLEADWACPDVRKVEMAVEATLDDGTRLRCDEDQLVEAVSGTRKSIFHRRDAPPPWFDIAGHEFSGQALDFVETFNDKPSVSATLHDGARVDEFIERALKVGVVPQ